MVTETGFTARFDEVAGDWTRIAVDPGAPRQAVPTGPAGVLSPQVAKDIDVPTCVNVRLML